MYLIGSTKIIKQTYLNIHFGEKLNQKEDVANRYFEIMDVTMILYY